MRGISYRSDNTFLISLTIVGNNGTPLCLQIVMIMEQVGETDERALLKRSPGINSNFN